MASFLFIRDRAAATHAAATSVASLYVWHERTLQQLNDAVAALDQLDNDESAKRTEWRNAAILWDNDLVGLRTLTSAVKRQGLFKFADDPVKKKLFAKLTLSAHSRADIYDNAQAARDAWREADAAWLVSGETELSSFSSMLTTALSRKATHGTKITAWRKSAALLRNKSILADRDSVAWYAEATRKFRVGTTEGDTIRSTITTTTRPKPAVGQAVISEVMISGRDGHLDFTAPHATRFTVLHQAPGSPVFLVLVTETKNKSLTLHNLAVGVHRFKVVGVNVSGEGPESEVREVTVAGEAAA